MTFLFPLKDKNDCKSCVIYKEDCSFSSRYNGKTKFHAEVTWSNLHNLSYNNLNKISEQSKHLRNNIGHCFAHGLFIISNALINIKIRKDLEGSYIALWRPDLNNSNKTLRD